MSPVRGTERSQGRDRTPPPALSPEDERFLGDLVRRLRESGLAPAALLWLASLRPLSFLGAQALHVAAPLLDLLLPADGVSRLARILERRDNFDLMLSWLEADGGPPTGRAASS